MSGPRLHGLCVHLYTDRSLLLGLLGRGFTVVSSTPSALPGLAPQDANGRGGGASGPGQDAGLCRHAHSLQANAGQSLSGAAARGLFRKAKSAPTPKQHTSNGQVTVRSRTCVLL